MRLDAGTKGYKVGGELANKSYTVMKKALCLGAMSLGLLGAAVGCATVDRGTNEDRVDSQPPPGTALAEAWDTQAGWTMGSSAAESF